MTPLLSTALGTERRVVIVKFRDGLVVGRDIPQHSCVLFQVTIDPSRVSPSGELIRFGDTTGDELIGWMLRANLEIVEELGVLQADGVKVKVA